MKLGDIINLTKYPIHQRASRDYEKVVQDTKSELADDGCARLSKFILPESLARMKTEIDNNISGISWVKSRHNPYFNKQDDSLDSSHPRNTFSLRSTGYLSSELVEQTSDYRFLFENDDMLNFVSDCFDVGQLYRYADPLAKHPYSIMNDGDYFPWHFDGNEYTISVLVKESTSGGVFEYAPHIRDKGNENFEGITEVLRGNRDMVKSLKLREGDLQFFKGRYSMHRVTKVEGESRYIAVPSYSPQPNRINKPEHNRQVYGKHITLEGNQYNSTGDGLND